MPRSYADAHFRRLQMELRCAEVEIGVLTRQLLLARADADAERSKARDAVASLQDRLTTEGDAQLALVAENQQLLTEARGLRALAAAQGEQITEMRGQLQTVKQVGEARSHTHTHSPLFFLVLSHSDSPTHTHSSRSVFRA